MNLGQANQGNIVQTSGAQSIADKKEFTVAPSAPAPSAATDLVNKGYVDALANQLRGEFQKISETTVTNIINVQGGALKTRTDLRGNTYYYYMQLYLAGKFQNEVLYDTAARHVMGNNG